MASLRALIPDADSVIAMHPSELAACVLEVLLSSGSPNLWHRDNFMMFAGSEYVNQHGQSNEDVSIACSAAWSWLDANGLITLRSFSSGWYVATPRGREVGGRANVYNLIANQQLPEEFLHPTVVANSRPLYLQSKLDTAVFEAFKALEIAIRTEAELGHDMVGVALAQRAFNPDTGQLTDPQC